MTVDSAQQLSTSRPRCTLSDALELRAHVRALSENVQPFDGGILHAREGRRSPVSFEIAGGW